MLKVVVIMKRVLVLKKLLSLMTAFLMWYHATPVKGVVQALNAVTRDAIIRAQAEQAALIGKARL